MLCRASLCLLAAACTALSACSSSAALKTSQAMRRGVTTSPPSTQAEPIAITQANGSVTITASEAGYQDGFSASIYTGEHCVNVTPVNGTTNQFTVSRVIGCNRVLVKVVDDVGNASSVYLRTE